MKNRLVAIVDDDISFADRLSDRLKEAGLETVLVSSGLELLSVLSIDEPCVIIVDTMLNWIDSRELIRALNVNSAFKEIKVILVTEQKTAEAIKNTSEHTEIFQKATATDLLIQRIIEETDSYETPKKYK